MHFRWAIVFFLGCISVVFCLCLYFVCLFFGTFVFVTLCILGVALV